MTAASVEISRGFIFGCCTLATYANSIRDMVEEPISSRQVSIESKLREIAGFLNVLPTLTQKIGSLESKVDSFEALLVERNSEIKAMRKSLRSGINSLRQ